ncbi:hypothetical protein LHYA1_G005138 [Lachnellula hyalina]|uniref:Sec20 C-terminal domain-containing protein n=1 Tax=Lachnellula hyalina TaxID=1316788 RepID=A0A8H8TZH8_9HELO|nr:uncharacterized protein LHYA1_G005138 [Lachnellula hyalina]TVY24986.1 hypothetical protein LHYA1_G005138 [Lachnellula hyalina]
MSFQSVSERLSALQESNQQLKTLIERLATIKFQPGSVPVNNEEDNVIGELTSEIHQMLKDQDEDFELLQEEALDLDTGRRGSEFEQQKETLIAVIKRAIKELKSCEIAFRKAQLEAKRNLHFAQRAEKRLLLESLTKSPSTSASTSPDPGAQAFLTPPRKPKADLSSAEREVNASSDVTAALRRTHDMMASELQRSQFAHDTLKESTAALAQLGETYSTLDTLLSSSKNLLGTLLRSQKSDTWYLETAFYILVVTIGWLVFRRILYGPGWWLLWFLPKMFIKGFMGVAAVLGITGGNIGGEAAGTSTSVLNGGSATVTHASAGRISVPTYARRPPGVPVGGGGKGGPMPQGTPAPQGQGGSVSEQVGRIIDESKEPGAGEEVKNDATEEEPAEQPSNPKKRMWEEDKEAAKEEQRKKDEL